MFTVCKDHMLNLINASGTVFLTGSTPGCGTTACLRQHGWCVLAVVRSPWWRQDKGKAEKTGFALYSGSEQELGDLREPFLMFHWQLGPLPIPEPVSLTLRWIGLLLSEASSPDFITAAQKRRGEMDVQDSNTVFTINSLSFCCHWLSFKFCTFKNGSKSAMCQALC